MTSDDPSAQVRALRSHDRRHMELLGRADRDLPPLLRHDAITAVAACHSGDQQQFKITFEGERLPVGYRERLDTSAWAIVDASIDHVRRDGLRGLLGLTEPRLAILVATDVPDLTPGGHQ